MAYYVYGINSSGSVSSDLMVGLTTPVVLNGDAGNDVIVGNVRSNIRNLSGFFDFYSGGTSPASALNLDGPTAPWGVGENPMLFDNGVTPFISIMFATGIGSTSYFSIFLAAGTTLTVDIDTNGTTTIVDTMAEIVTLGGTVLASDDDSPTSSGGLGSITGTDPYLTYTAAVSGTYYIRIGQYNAGILSNFTTSADFIFNVSLTGHSATTFNISSNDVLSGGLGDDQIGGGPGNDTIVGNDGNDWLIGGSGNDTMEGGQGFDRVFGSAGDDTIFGGTQGDVLSGGPGNDTFIDTTAAFQGDSITDLGIGDRIVFTNAALASFTYRVDNTTLIYSGGALTLSSVTTGTIIASASAGGGVQLIMTPALRAGDFNGDGRADILWRSDSGAIATWLANANGNSFTPAWGTGVSLDWHVAGIGDFNGDNRSDILWRSDAGGLANWQGAANGGFTPVWGTTLGIDWSVVGTGDFNGDGRDDILWRNTNGALADWLGAGNGGFTAAWGTSVDAAWSVNGTGDFNGDGRSDLLWRSSAGELAVWLGAANGGFTPTWGTTLSGDWRIAGTGDFNGDGRSDVIWRTDDGGFAEWLGAANGGLAPAWGTSVATDHRIATIGDFNGDNRDDILWQTDTDAIYGWLGAATGFVGNPGLAIAAPDGWTI